MLPSNEINFGSFRSSSDPLTDSTQMTPLLQRLAPHSLVLVLMCLDTDGTTASIFDDHYMKL